MAAPPASAILGPLDATISEAIDNEQAGRRLRDLSLATATSRAACIRDVRANYLASPPLVVAYSLLGTMTEDITTAPLGQGSRRQAGLSEGHLAHQ